METTIRKWGNSLGIRIPKIFAEEMKINDGTKVSLELNSKSIIIKPKQKAVFMLNDMLEQITDENTHNEVDTGASEGKEEW